MDLGPYITGFVDGEGCFSVSFSLRKKMKLGVEVRPSFAVSQHSRNKDIIVRLQQYFHCGGVRFNKRDQNYKFEVRSTKDLIERVIPHFKKYPLQTSKASDFNNFEKVCLLVKSNHHLNQTGLEEILQLSEQINTTGNKRYKRDDLLRLILGNREEVTRESEELHYKMKG